MYKIIIDFNMKLLKYLAGFGAGLAILGAVEAEPYTRKELGIPESKQENFIMEGINQDGIYIKQFDMNDDGIIDLEQAYYCVIFKGIVPIPMERPFGLWYDLNRNKKVDYDSEVFYSPLMDEDWVQMDPNNLTPTDYKKETKC